MSNFGRPVFNGGVTPCEANPSAEETLGRPVLAWKLFADWLKRVKMAREGRAAVAAMRDMDPRILRDIGLEPSSIELAMKVRWDEDPTLVLKDIRMRRVGADRAGKSGVGL